MSYKDLQAFIHDLEGSDRLKHVTAEVDKNWEIACIARWVLECVDEEDQFAIQFDRVTGYTVPVVVGLYSSRTLYAQALNVEANKILPRWSQALQSSYKPNVVVSAPVMEVIATGDAINLLDIPVPVWTPGRDGGPYIPSASVITKDPETGIQNMGVYRVQVHDKQTTGLFFGTESQHGAMHYAKYCRRDEPMPVAIVVGGPPSVNFAAAAKTAYGVDELEIAGGLAGAGIEVVPGATVDLLVPAHAEYVIEGFIPPGRRAQEGPFGEALGYMNLAAPAPVVEVSAVCQKKAPIFHGYLQQVPPSEGHIVWEMGLIGPLWFYLTEKMRLDAVQDLAVVRGSAGLAMVAVQVKMGCGAEAREIGKVLATINFGQRFIILVDEDIDVHDLESLQWAMSTRVDPARDTTVVEDVASYQRDPSVRVGGTGDKSVNDSPPYSSSMMIIDATMADNAPEISFPGESFMEKVWERWPEFGLPELKKRGRTARLLRHHSETELLFKPKGAD